jgi:uncharacterized protein YndB with AHSA1/START domain
MSHDIRLGRRLAVAPEVAFHHWVDAEERRIWYRGDEDDWVVTAQTDLRVGGRFVVRWGPTLDDAYQEDGTFEVVEPPHRLVYTSRFTPRTAAEGAPFELRVAVTFDADGDGTLLRVVESGYPTAEVRDAFLRDGLAQGLDFYERTLPTPA